ncbi:MAG: hypothetical protein H0V51_02080 [Chloroflexi bacterium]|nr:hypothetical protein [Chloroflexota bacterium]
MGVVVMEDALTGPGPVRPVSCPVGRNVGEFVGEGYFMKVTGRCSAADQVAGIASMGDGVTLSDGEVRLEVKAVTGVDQARFATRIRVQPDRRDFYLGRVVPATGEAEIVKVTGADVTILAATTVPAGLLSPDGWNTMAVRAAGPNLWLLLNDQPVLSAADSAYERGRVRFAASRLGSLDDDRESSVVVRNLRVSGLAAGDQARLPTYQAPTTAAPVAAGPPPPPCSTPVEVPRAFRSVTPPAGVAPDIAAFYGVWEGTWSSPFGSLPSLLAVEDIDAAGATVQYAWADDGGSLRAGGVRAFPRVLSDGALTWGGDPKFTFRMSGDLQTIAGVRESRGSISTVTMTRCSA